MQVELIQLLQGDRGHISVVGDDFQSIYGFRGAQPDVFPRFIDQFSHEHLNKPLEINYRYTVSQSLASCKAASDTCRLQKPAKQVAILHSGEMVGNVQEQTRDPEGWHAGFEGHQERPEEGPQARARFKQ